MACCRSWVRFNSIVISALTVILATEGRSATFIGSSDYSLFTETDDLPVANNWVNSDNIDNVADMFVSLDQGQSIQVFGNDAFVPSSSSNINTSVNRSLSFESVIDSFQQIRWDLEGNPIAADVPVLSQTSYADVLKDVYDFPGTPTPEPEAPQVAPQTVPQPSQGSGPVAQVGSPSAPVTSPNANLAGEGLPNLGGPLAVIALPQAPVNSGIAPVAAPSVVNVGSSSLDNNIIDVFFAHQPQTEIVDIKTFLGTRYRTNISDAIQQIEKSLDTTIDTEIPSMPRSVFANPFPKGFNASSTRLLRPENPSRRN